MLSDRQKAALREADDEWKREAKIEQSYYARSQNGEKHYMLMAGSNPVLPPELQPAARASMTISALILNVIEPIPTTDDFYEDD